MGGRREVISLAVMLAFSDPSLFGDGVDKGGSAGRYFTGSHVDGYACDVCHRGGGAAKITVDGIPDQPVAGQTYQLTVRWTTDADHPQALEMELIGANGAHPQVSIAPAAQLPAESRCEGSATGDPAATATDLGARRIIGVSDCGASAVTVSFAAVNMPIELAISGVRSDGSGTVEGDGTVVLRQRIGDDLHASGSGCDAGGGDAGLLLGLAAAMAARRRRAR